LETAVKTTCKDCGAELEITDERTFLKCFKCGSQTIVDVEPPWALAGLDYVAPPPPTSISDRPPPPLRHDHAPASHRVEALSPLSGELVEGDDLVYAKCESCGKEFEGNASFLRCPFCGVTNTVDTAPPWAVSGDLVEESAPARPSSVPPPPPRRPKGNPAQVWQEWKTAEVASDGGTTRQAVGRASGGSGALVVLGLVVAMGVGAFVLFAASAVEEETVAAPIVEPPAAALDIDRVEAEIEGVVNAGATTHWSCEKALANYQANRDPDIEFEPVPDGVFGEVLRNVDYRELCKLPAETSVQVCAAIQRGRAVGVTVTTEPSDPILERCLGVHVRALHFPSYPALQVARTTFVPLDEGTEEAEPAVPERVPGPLPAAPALPPSPRDNPY
jgi:DNA-directed RNA polymerase subunit RPC12/RpoP